MGYYTDFNLDIRRKPITEELEGVLNDKKHSSGYGPLMNFVTGRFDSCKWYDHADDLRELSARFPEHLFVLHGIGEDGESWIKYFLGGKMQFCPGKVVFPEFDEDKLK